MLEIFVFEGGISIPMQWVLQVNVWMKINYTISWAVYITPQAGCEGICNTQELILCLKLGNTWFTNSPCSKWCPPAALGQVVQRSRGVGPESGTEGWGAEGLNFLFELGFKCLKMMDICTYFWWSISQLPVPEHTWITDSHTDMHFVPGLLQEKGSGL